MKNKVKYWATAMITCLCILTLVSCASLQINQTNDVTIKPQDTINAISPTPSEVVPTVEPEIQTPTAEATPDAMKTTEPQTQPQTAEPTTEVRIENTESGIVLFDLITVPITNELFDRYLVMQTNSNSINIYDKSMREAGYYGYIVGFALNAEFSKEDWESTNAGGAVYGAVKKNGVLQGYLVAWYPTDEEEATAEIINGYHELSTHIQEQVKHLTANADCEFIRFTGNSYNDFLSFVSGL